MNEQEMLVSLLSARVELEDAYLKHLKDIPITADPDFSRILTDKLCEERDFVLGELDKRIKTLQDKLNSKGEG